MRMKDVVDAVSRTEDAETLKNLMEDAAAILQAALAGLDAGICYAVKANGNGAVLRLIGEEGAGADIVSGGELQRALRAGIPADRIVFSGVGKTDAEIAMALQAGIARFNVESRAELDAIQRIAAASGCTARASVRINPDFDGMSDE